MEARDYKKRIGDLQIVISQGLQYFRAREKLYDHDVETARCLKSLSGIINTIALAAKDS